MKQTALPPRAGREKVLDAAALETLQQFGFHYARGSRTLPYFPPVVWLELTNDCALRCPICPTGLGRGGRRGMMPMPLFDKLTRELSRYPVIRTALYYRGESLLHPRVVECVALAAHRGLTPYLHTSAVGLDRELSRRLIDAGLTYIAFSLDGATAEVYERARPGARFSEVVENVRCFLELKREMKAERLVTIVHIMNPAGHRHAARFRRLFAGLPLDRVVPARWHNWAGTLPLPGTAAQRGRQARCADPWQRLVIGWDGSAFGCCQDAEGAGCIGDARRQTLAAIWNGTPLQRLRQRIARGTHRRTALCRGCTYLGRDGWTI